MHRRFGIDLSAGTLIAAALVGFPAHAQATAPASAVADSAGAPHLVPAAARSAKAPCFFRRDWVGGWKATPDARTIYIRVSGSVYRLDLQSSYSLLKDPFSVLRNRDSAEQICGPLDFRLTVSNQVGGEQWPIVTQMTRLTPAQAAALPKRLRP
jgi:hypothetical protein